MARLCKVEKDKRQRKLVAKYKAKRSELREKIRDIDLSFEEKLIESKFSICPDCASPIVYSEGCRSCINSTCGWSKCS